MSGLLRYFALKAQAGTGFSTQIIVWAVVALIAAVLAFAFLLVAAYVWLAERYGSLAAGLALGIFFLLIASGAAIACVVTRRSNIRRAQAELAARSSANWLDPKLLGV